MRTVEITILAADIESSNYFICSECAITKALHRAGYPNLTDRGRTIEDEQGNVLASKDRDEDYCKIVEETVAMYQTAGKLFGSPSISLQDRTYTLNLHL